MSYYFAKELSCSMDEAVAAVTEGLATEGFGVLTEIDVKATLKKKIDVDFRRYVILGACNPPLAHQALGAEPLLGLLLPCNLVVMEREEGGSIVAALKPTAAFELVDKEPVRVVLDVEGPGTQSYLSMESGLHRLCRSTQTDLRAQVEVIPKGAHPDKDWSRLAPAGRAKNYLELELKALESGYPMVKIPGAFEYNDVLDLNVSKYLAGDFPTAKAALDAVAQRWSELNEKFGVDKQKGFYAKMWQ